MTDYSDHADVLKALKEDQEAEYDLRESISEQINFLHHPQGQWEPAIWEQNEGRPRYTIDITYPKVCTTWAEMAQNEYTATTSPAGEGADEDVSNIIDGMLRNIYNCSDFPEIATKEGKRVIAHGFGCWRVVAVEEDRSFYQELKAIRIHDSHMRVWFQSGSEMQTREDADHVFVLSSLTQSKCDETWPERDGKFRSIDDMRSSDTYQYKPSNTYMIGEILYKKWEDEEIYLMADGRVVSADMLEDEMESPVDSKRSRSARFTLAN